MRCLEVRGFGIYCVNSPATSQRALATTSAHGLKPSTATQFETKSTTRMSWTSRLARSTNSLAATKLTTFPALRPPSECGTPLMQARIFAGDESPRRVCMTTPNRLQHCWLWANTGRVVDLPPEQSFSTHESVAALIYAIVSSGRFCIGCRLPSSVCAVFFSKCLKCVIIYCAYISCSTNVQLENWSSVGVVCQRSVGKVCAQSFHGVAARSVCEMCLQGLCPWSVRGLYVVAQ